VAHHHACLCIVSRDRLRGSDFVAALRASLRPHDQLEIIIDRRSGEPSDEWDRAEDRRRRPQVELALRANGFAVVPAPGPQEGRTPLSLLLPAAPSTRAVPEDDDDDERLEAIRSFKRERSGGLVPWLVAALVAVATAAFLLSPTGQTVKKNLAHRIAPEAPGPSNQPPAQTPDASAVTRGPVVAEKPGVAETPARPPATEIPPPARSLGGPASSGAAGTEPAPPPDAATDNSPRDTSTAPAESSPAPRAATGAAGRGRPRSSETVRPNPSPPVPRPAAGAPSSTEPVSRAISPRFAGLPRVELTREPGASSGAYAVRIADPAGKPLADAEVLLLARMADGTVENVRMGFFPDQGTYRGTLPPTRSAPVDLRIRVITGDKRVEVPLGPSDAR